MTARRVVHAVRSDGFAGVERYICDVSGELARRGWDVVVVGGSPERMRAELGAGVGFRPARTTLQVALELAKLRSRLVHSHMSAADIASVMTRQGKGTARISTRHFAHPRGSNPVTRSLGLVVERRLNAGIAISAFVARHGGGPSEVTLLNGVRVQEHPLPWEDRRDQVAVVQRHEPEKDTATVLHAWVGSRAQERGWRLRLAGRGSETGALVALADRLGIGDTVDVLGFVPDPAVLLASSKALVATATAEPYGLAVVEAMAQGTPVLATRSGAHPETLGAAARLFAPGDAAACRALLDELVAEQFGAEAYGRALQQRQAEVLALDVHVDALEKLYEGLL